MDNNKRQFVSFTFDEPFQLSSEYFENMSNENERRHFGFLDVNRKAVFGQITADGKTVQIYMAENEMYDITITRKNGGISTIIGRLERLANKAFCLNDAYIIEEQQIRNQSINIPPKLDRRSGYLNIELLERASKSIMKIEFDNNQDRYANAYFSFDNLVFVMPGNRGHEIHFEQAINNHAKTSLALVGKSIAQQFIHDYMENALFDGQWNDVEEILPGLFTHIGIQRYQRGP